MNNIKTIWWNRQYWFKMSVVYFGSISTTYKCPDTEDAYTQLRVWCFITLALDEFRPKIQSLKVCKT